MSKIGNKVIELLEKGYDIEQITSTKGILSKQQ